MEQLTKTLTIRLTASEYALLISEAERYDRPLSYIAREKIRKAIAN